MNKHTPTDETLYCERCGISFLWSSEEQRPSAEEANAKRPQLCPGCTQLLPQPGCQRGLVKWFNHRKRYGFLSRTDSADLFVHRSSVSDRTRLHPGDLVEFTVTESERGPAAADVRLLARANES